MYPIKAFIMAMPMLWFIVIAGCGDGGKPVKAEETVLKTQRDALENAKKIDRIVLGAAAEQRENIDKETE